MKQQLIGHSIITRWGSQFAALKSILRSERALYKYVDRLDVATRGPDQPAMIIQTVNDTHFWQDLRILSDILEPIHEAQKMSESDKSSLSKVRPRWQEIRNKWDALRARYDSPNMGWEKIYQLYQARYEKQSNMESKAAWCLDPQTRGQAVRHTVSQEVIAFLIQKSGDLSEEDRQRVDRDFYEFRAGAGAWYSGNFSENLLQNPQLFWMSIRDTGTPLAKPAARLLNCLANSVPSERSFSSQNHIHSGMRNRLEQEKVNKLTFIYFNYRVLHKRTKTWEALVDSEVAELEDGLFDQMRD